MVGEDDEAVRIAQKWGFGLAPIKPGNGVTAAAVGQRNARPAARPAATGQWLS
jgi:hypothetical protein